MSTTANRVPRQWQAFLIALATATAIFLPFILYDKGYFIYYGDFNVQQIPFYKLAHEAVRSGDIFWNWHTDLGVNFIGSYSFYLLFSPFFWLTLPFPTSWLPFLMAPLLILKTACASLTAYLYLQRMVRDTNYAVIGSLLYAFSGWMAFNIFFNHFHEVAVFFPLLLLGVEKLVVEEKKGFFAAMVLLNALVNYWFFVGEVVFVVLYVLVRMTDRSWGMTPKKFALLALESVLGVGMAAFLILPSVLVLLGNPRTSTDRLYFGWGFWLYYNEQRLPAILHSLVYPPDLPSAPNFFPANGAKWASMSGWLPMMSLTGVMAYFFSRQKDWLKRVLTICLVLALVPGLNSLFVLLNNAYYARWFYMPILLMCLATARALEQSSAQPEFFSRGIRWTGVAIGISIVVCGLTPNTRNDEWTIGLADDKFVLWMYVGVAVLGLLCTLIFVLFYRQHRHFATMMMVGIAVVAAGFTIFYMALGRNNRQRADYVIHTAIQGREQIQLPEEQPFARIDIFEGMDNLGMYWHRPTIQAFHSVVPVSLMDFYPTVGVTRDVASRPDAQQYALRPLLSVRWLFIQNDNEEQQPMMGYTKVTEQIGFNVYENDYYLPMGFAYDQYLTRSQLEDIDERFRSNAMLRAVVLEEDAIADNQDLLRNLNTQRKLRFGWDAMRSDVKNRSQVTAHSFAIGKGTFTAQTDFQRDQLLFFSVPFEKGWTATINGQPTKVYKANIGFMAVRVPPGQSTIEFRFFPPGLRQGLLISAASLVLLAGYLVVTRKKAVETSRELNLQRALFQGETVNLSWEEYLAEYQDKEARAARLQQALNQAGSIHMQSQLPPDQQSFDFSPHRVTDEAHQPTEEEQ